MCVKNAFRHKQAMHIFHIHMRLKRVFIHCIFASSNKQNKEMKGKFITTALIIAVIASGKKATAL